MTTTMNKTGALKVPILPHTSPQAEQPPGMKLPLHPHQLRALNRCLVIEQDGSLSGGFGDYYNYTSRGGCLADEVGTGKTATSIGLVLSGQEGNGGDTLVVAPKHLIPQWKMEVEKFATSDVLQVIVGKDEYEQKCSAPAPKGQRRIVLVDVDSILNEKSLWYNFRRVFSSEKGPPVKVSPQQIEVYKKAALFCVKSPKGPCSYDGLVYDGSLHIPQRPWRRVIFDEIQDLVAEGKESQKNLLQLTRTASHVWLLSATPFPHGNKSVYANHELLGFCRLRMDVEVDDDHPLSSHHTFERIKRKLYIRSPRHVVANHAVTATQHVTRNTVDVSPLDLEMRFYNLESNRIRQEQQIQPQPRQRNATDQYFSGSYRSLREMTVHPEASEELRTIMSQNSSANSNSNHRSRPVSTSVTAAANRAVRDAKERLRVIDSMDMQSLTLQLMAVARSIALAKKVVNFRHRTPLKESVFNGPITNADIQDRKDKQAKILHSEYCSCFSGLGGTACYADSHVMFRIIQKEGSLSQSEFIKGPGSTQQLIDYFDTALGEGVEVNHGTGMTSAIQNYISVTQRTYNLRATNIQNLEKESRELKNRAETLSKATTTASKANDPCDELAKMNGSKPAALIRYLKKVVEDGEQAIVFSYWHDTLKLIRRTLNQCGLKSVFCEGHQMASALEQFTMGDIPIILLSAQSKASGANLQCATHVVLLDPAGSSAEHGSTLEEQAIGRAVRMGQDRPVTITRFCVVGTLEDDMFRDIDLAAEKAKVRASDSGYVIQDAFKATPQIQRPASLEENNGVEVIAALTQEERIQRNFQEAEMKGDVIVMLDSDGEDNSTPQKRSAAKKPSAARSHVKLEYVSTKRDMPETPLKETPDPSAQQALGLVGEGDEPLISLQTRTKRTRADYAGGLDDEGDRPLISLKKKTKRTRGEGDEPLNNIFPEPAKDTPTVSTNTPTPASRTPSSVTPSTPEVSMADTSIPLSPQEAGADEAHSLKNREAGIKQLLRRFDLSEYQDKFIESGYDSVGWLYELAEDVELMETLAVAVGFKPGHAIRFQCRLLKEGKEKSTTRAI